MKRRFTRCALLLIAALSASCATDMVRITEIADLVTAVSDRHDAYVTADPTVTDEQKRVFLRSTTLLRMVIEKVDR